MTDKKSKGLLRNIISVTGIAMIAKALGFVKQMITASSFGVSLDTDMLALSSGIVGNIDYVLIQTMLTAFIPVYMCAKAESAGTAARFTSDALKFCVCVACVGVLLLELTAFPTAKLLAPSYPMELTLKLSAYIRIYAPGLIFVFLIAFFGAVLRANESFIPGELIHLNQHISVIAVILLLRGALGVHSQILAFYVYAVMNFLLMAAAAKRYWHIEKGEPLHDKYVKNLLRMSTPLLFGYSMVYINQQVDKILISGLERGSVTAVGYAGILNNFITTLVGSSCAVLFPYISKNAVERKGEAVAKLVFQSSIMMVTFLLPLTLITVCNAEDIVQIVYGRGAFDEQAVSIAAKALAGYAFMFAPLAIRDIFSRVHYSYGNSKSPAANSAIGIVFNIIFSVLLSRWYGVLGVAFATSFSVMITAALNIFSACIYHLPFRIREFFICLPLWGLGGIVCVMLWRSGRVWWSADIPLLRFVFTALLSGLGYLICSLPILWPYLKRYIVDIVRKIFRS